MRVVSAAVAVFALAALALPGPAWGAAGAYQENDSLGFRNVLPPGTNGLANATGVAQYAAGGTFPPHSGDQLAMYGDLVYATPGLKPEDLDRFFKDASFGARPDDVARTYSPRADVTIVRDASFGVAHIYGDTRAGAMFGAGYVAAEDRLFFIDILRHLGRAQLSSFAGGAQGNRDFDREQWEVAPYAEEDLQRQYDQFDDLYGAEGEVIQRDADNYTAGVNAYIAAARTNSALMPAEYAAINRPQGPADWTNRDVIAIAALVGGIFGKGGGGELRSAEFLLEAQRRFGRRAGRSVWRDFRTADDPETSHTVHSGRSFPYTKPPRRRKRGSLALWDRGSLEKHSTVASGASSSGAPSDGIVDGLLAGGFPGANSNALLVSAKESESGRPLAVFGPQTGYFAPQILMEMDIHAPAVNGEPGIDARGASFPGTNLYVQLGRGRDYAWSATSAGQDNIDTFALELCEPDGSAPTLSSMHYLFRGDCTPIEVLRRENSWTPNAADQTPAGSETLEAHRTKLGIVAARATIRGRPVIYTKLRSTYMHEVDSALGFVDFNAPERMRNPRDFQRAAAKIGYTFNWFYADDRHIAYFNSGHNPVRARGTETDLPVRGDFEWKRWNPDTWTAGFMPASRKPQVVDQSFLTSWNNAQAPGYRAADSNWSFGAVHRVESLDDRIARGIRGRRKMSLTDLVEAMEEAGTVDLRATKVLPWALRAMRGTRDPKALDAIAKLRAWVRAGGQRRDTDRDRVYEHAEAIRILDAWWPLLLEAQFKPRLGEDAFDALRAVMRFDNEPNNGGGHLGSAYQDGWYGYASKDLRRVLGRRVRGRWSRRAFCGNGSLARCRSALVSSLVEAADRPAAEVYGEDGVCDGQPAIGPSDPGRRSNDQWCHDAVWHRPLGAINHPLIHWINRPTFQQVVEVQGHGPRR